MQEALRAEENQVSIQVALLSRVYRLLCISKPRDHE
jgi:hypothetical protein